MQNNFVIDCALCSRPITKERLAVHKLVRDLVRDYRDGQELHKYGLGVYLAWVLFFHFHSIVAIRSNALGVVVL